MRTITGPERSLVGGNFQLYPRISVKDSDQAWRDITTLSGIDWFEDAEWGADIDQPVMNGTVSLRREQAGQSLAPLLVASLLNRDAANAYAPLLYAGRGIKIETACTAVGVAPVVGDYKEVFFGKIDELDWASSDSLVRLNIRDEGARLLDGQIENPTVYSTPSGVLVQTIIQQILTQWGPNPAVILYTPVSPGWLIKEYEQLPGSILEAIRALALQIGWDIRYKYDAAGVFRLTFYDPRAPKAVPDTSFGPGEYLDVKALTIGDADVRNVVRVYFTP